MKKIVSLIFQALSAASYRVAAVGATQWSFYLSNQPECPEEIVK